MTSLGAGGVIYLTPLVFNQIELSATQIGSGFAWAAFAGTLSRLRTGRLLDKGASSALAIKYSALFGMAADFLLFNAHDYKSFALGEMFLGIAAGIYWPGIELAVPSSCGRIPSSKGFALVRSADALGTSIGALLGSFSALFGFIRMIYLLDILCMVSVLVLLVKKPLKDKRVELINRLKSSQGVKEKDSLRRVWEWLPQLFPVLGLSILATSILTLLQSILPLDLVNGGISRHPVNETWSGMILALQLCLLVFFQWPVGRWLSDKKLAFGLGISFANFCIGCLLLGLSALWNQGIVIALIAQFPLAFALSAFLPTATEAVIKISPIENRGIAMAMFSQCFAISALIAPFLAGIAMDFHGTAMNIWLTMSLACFAMLPLTKHVRRKIICNQT